MVRGGCKAGINSNYTATKITPQNPAGQNTDYVGEMTKSALADDGRVFYGGRAICYAGPGPQRRLGPAEHRPRLRHVHVWDPRVEGPNADNPAKITKVAELSVFGNKGNAHEYGQASTSEAGLVAMTLDPDFTKGRPYMYIQYYPYWGGEQGKDTPTKLGMGFDRRSYKGEKRLSRFTYDEATKTFVPGSEKVIFSYVSPVYNCCHNGAGMAWDSKGNLYITNGDNAPNGTQGNGPENWSNNNTGGYTNPHPRFTIPCPGMGPTTHCGEVPADQRPADTGPLVSYGDVRGDLGQHERLRGQDRPHQAGGRPGRRAGARQDVHDPRRGRPQRPEPVPGGQPAGARRQGQAGDLRDGRAQHVHDPHRSEDRRDHDRVDRPRPGHREPGLGPGQDRERDDDERAGNWGWPFCQAGNRWSYRAKTPHHHAAAAAAPFGHPNTVGGGADGATGGYFDCRGEIVNDSPYNTGLTTLPKPKPVNIWYGPQGGCFGYPVNQNGVNVTTTTNNSAGAGDQPPLPVDHRRQPGADRRRHLPQAGG